MKKIVFVLFIVLLAGCILQKEQYDRVRKTPKLKIKTPPGCVWLRDSSFIDMTEISNLDYLEFLYWYNQREPEKVKTLLPDTLVWRHKLHYCEPYVEYYFRHPAYRDYPVVGISYEQAIEYCKWRSKMVNLYYYVQTHKVKWETSRDWDTITHAPEIVRYRLPTKEEWEYAAAAGLDSSYEFGYERLTGKKTPQVSCIRSTDGNYLNDETDYPMNVHSGKPNKYGILNLLGNVSELTADTTVKGYNFLISYDGAYSGSDSSFATAGTGPQPCACYRRDYRYPGPKSWLGFRCVCDVLK